MDTNIETIDLNPMNIDDSDDDSSGEEYLEQDSVDEGLVDDAEQDDGEEDDAEQDDGEEDDGDPTLLSLKDVGDGASDNSTDESGDNSSEYDEDSDEDDEEYFKKFDSELRKKHLTTFHPESFSNNYDEISKLTRVVRDEDNIIIDPLHKTAPFLTKYEYTKILGVRAKQIDSGATPFIKVPENMIDSYLIAKLELAEKRVPFIIRRPIANGSSEYWNVKDLEILVN